MNENEVLAGRLKDLAQRSYYNNIYTFSHFLGEGELSVLFQMEAELRFAGIRVYGGMEDAQRCMVRFGNASDLGYEQEFPIACLKIEPAVPKFAQPLSHRDYLGALMGLGIERELLGDILTDTAGACLFCADHIADYIRENLTQVSRTNVRVLALSEPPEQLKPKLREMHLIVPSERLDAVLAEVWKLSRSRSQNLFPAGKVFVNGKQWEKSSYIVKPGDRISVRGFGKFIYAGSTGTTGKGRCRIRVDLFV